MNYVTLTFDLTHDLDLVFFKVKFKNSTIKNCYLIDAKWKENKSVRYWADCMVSPFDRTHDLYLEVSRSMFEITLFQEREADWHGTKGMRLIIHDHDHNLWVLMVGWADVRDSECCLLAPSHYLNQCWLTISEVKWQSPKGNFIGDTSANNY